jgi:hypothetical protein
MALYINYKTEWHIGEPIPTDIGRVVTLQADGDELELILDAMGARWSRVNDPFGVIAATISFRDGRRINLTQKALDLLGLQGDREDPQPKIKTNPLFWIAASSLEPTVVYGELARPENN